jgi:signal transduction histidine kinase
VPLVRNLKRAGWRLFQSTIFRLTLLYTTFFCVSLLLLLTFVYFATVREMESEIKHRISTEANEMKTEYTGHGIEALQRLIGQFLEDEDEGLAIYLLTDAQGKVLAGNMESWPVDIEYEGNWLNFEIESRKPEEGVNILGRENKLVGGYRLLVGYSLRGPDRARKVMLDAVSASFVFAFFITGFSGAVFSGLIRRRLERVNQICAQVISGNLDVKVPLTGGADEFDNLAGNVNAMLDRIAALVTGLRQTSDNIAHDLRTPLARHRNRLESMMTHTPRSHEVQEVAKAGIDEVDTLLETLNSILRISQAQSGVASGHFVTFDLSTVVIDVIEFYDELAGQKDIAIHGSVPLDIYATGDKPLITQAVANLIDNAIKYTPEGGQIAITLSRQDGWISCVVADNGPGIPPEFHEKVKERFFRMEESRTSKGTGLGLSLVDAVAQLHRGELLLGDKHPGLIATLRLPIGVEALLSSS